MTAKCSQPRGGQKDVRIDCNNIPNATLANVCVSQIRLKQDAKGDHGAVTGNCLGGQKTGGSLPTKLTSSQRCALVGLSFYKRQRR